jgi:hypothetical protein
MVLLGKPSLYQSSASPSQPLLSKFGLAPLPDSLPPDRVADLLPVLLVTDTSLFGTTALLLNRRTGYLIGDLNGPGGPGGGEDEEGEKKPALEMFVIQPLWFGGTSGGEVGTGEGG